MNSKFWDAIDKLVLTSEIVIERPKGSSHPRFPEFIYPLDYGYLKNTKGSDGAEIDIWQGSRKDLDADAIICTVDKLKMDAEIKILIGCTGSEKPEILEFHNRSENMAGILIERGN
jgi:inorganic pyrophosphatase